MKKLNRKETQVSRDFKAILKRSSQNVTRNTVIDSSINSSSFPNIYRRSKTLSASNNPNETISDWKPLDSQIISANINEIVLQNKAFREDLNSNPNEGHLSTRSKTESKKKILNNFFLDKIFSNALEIPFEGTDINNLPFILPIIKESKEYLKIKVYKYFTVEKIIEKIAKKKSIDFHAIALCHKNTRLENHITLSWYNINSNSDVNLQILSKHRYHGLYIKEIYTIFIYTSEKIDEIKLLYSKEIKENPNLFELKYKEIFLNDCKQFFLYCIPEDSTIEIIKKRPNSIHSSTEYGKSPGFEVAQSFLAMTNNLKQCNCENIRIEAMACAFQSTFDKDFKNHKCLELLDDFGSRLHLKSCIKNKTNGKNEDQINSIDETCLHEFIDTEIGIIQKHRSNQITTTDLEYLFYTQNFRGFKQFLRDKIGTKCTNASLSMLYLYAKSLVDFLNSRHESDEKINKILDYIRRYFVKYFEKQIIAKGGLANFTPKEHFQY